MRCRIVLSIFPIGLLSVCLAFGNAWGADAKCALARKIGQEAAKRFAGDHEDGLRLFIKAQSMCPEDADLNFNLGYAYYNYGRTDDSLKFITAAVEKNSNNPQWLNLFAWILLETGNDSSKAMRYAKKAGEIDPGSAAIQDTVVNALIQTGKSREAVETAYRAKKKWPRDVKIAGSYEKAVDQHMARYLRLTKAGNYDQAIAGLFAIDFDADIADAHCWVLQSEGRVIGALENAEKAKARFPKAEAVKDTFDRIMDRFIQECYKRFTSGDRATAIEAVDAMREKYRKVKDLDEAYGRMFKAVLADARDISVPPPAQFNIERNAAGGKGAKLLNEIKGGEVAENAPTLLVDVDTNIPAGKKSRPYAVAVIIGNKHYSRHGNGIPDVDFAGRDAAYVKKYVIQVLGYKEENIIYEPDVTSGKLSTIFGDKESHKGKLFGYVRPERSEVFVYYCGHGAPDRQGNQAYLVPVDADAAYIDRNGYSLETLYHNLSQIRAKRMTVIIDACFSGTSAGGMLIKNISPGMLKPANPIRKLDNSVVFCSTGKGQVSNWYTDKQHGLFTYFFLKRLQGSADTNKDKTITVEEMAKYLKEEVSYRAQRTGMPQTPVVAATDDSWELVVLELEILINIKGLKEI